MSWEDEDNTFESKIINPFAGEDEDGDVLDSWDAEEEPIKKEIEVKKKVEAPKSKFLQKELQQKEQKKNSILTGIELENFSKDAEYEIFKDTFDIKPKVTGIDDIQVKTKEDFEKLGQLITKKLLPLDTNSNYISFLENVMRDVVVNVEVDNLKKLSSMFSALANEKVKLIKNAGKKKKASKAPKIATFRDNDCTNYDEVYNAEYIDDDDF